MLFPDFLSVDPFCSFTQIAVTSALPAGNQPIAHAAAEIVGTVNMNAGIGF